MSSKATTTPKSVITKNSSEFRQDEYASIPTGELVVLAVAVLHADASPAAVEEIVSTCFRLFPHSFSLKNYFYWPDSALVTRRLQDAKEKGLLKGSPADGYELKGKGRQSAKHTAKTLGVSLPVPPKVEEPAPAPVVTPKAEEAVAAPQVKVVVEKKEAAIPTPVKKKTSPKKKVEKKEPTRKAKPKPAAKKAAPKPQKKTKAQAEKKPKGKVKPQIAVKPVKPAPKAKPHIKKEPAKPRVVKKPAPQKARPAKEEPRPKAKIKKAKVATPPKAKPTQLAMELTPPTARKKAETPATKPKVKGEAAKPVKGEVMPAVAVSKEEKDKATKVIKQLERSDAYQLYRRNGRRAQIGEFDFRNMLYATMESSAETLKRNLELFKRYAGIHFRTDLIAFLEFCEEHFAGLLKTKAKLKR